MLKLRTERILLISIRHLQERIIQDYALLAHAEVRRLTPHYSQGKKFCVDWWWNVPLQLLNFWPKLLSLFGNPCVLSVSLFREAIVIHVFQPFFNNPLVRTNIIPPWHTKFTNRGRTKLKEVYFRYFLQGLGRFCFALRDFSPDF